MVRTFKYLFVMLAVATLFSTTACMSEKKIVYLQGADTLYAVPQQITQAFELEIQPDDELAISVDTKTPELLRPYNSKTMIGSGITSSSSSDSRSSYSSSYGSQSMISSHLAYFLVDKKGNIDFPVFGIVSTKGKTCRQLADDLQERFRNAEEKVADAVVTVKVMSFKVTVLGDVKAPGTQNFQGERLTLLEAIGRAGDLNASARRDNVLVVREIADTRVTYQIDLRDPEQVFNSPAYYMQQNDIVYVQPNKSVRVKGSTGYLLLSIGATIVSMLVSITSLVIALINVKK